MAVPITTASLYGATPLPTPSGKPHDILKKICRRYIHIKGDAPMATNKGRGYGAGQRQPIILFLFLFLFLQ